MAFPDSTWPDGGDEWYEWSTSSEVNAIWDIESFLRKCQESKKQIRSPFFLITDAKCNFFTSFELKKGHSQFGVNFRPYSLSDEVIDCYFDIKFFDNNDMEIKKIEFELSSRADSHRAVKDFLSSHELERFLQKGCTAVCCISVRKSGIEEACPREEIAGSSSNSAMETLTQSQTLLLHYHPMAFPDLTWTEGGSLPVSYYEIGEQQRIYSAVLAPWNFESSLRQSRNEQTELRSPTFTFVGARWNFFTSFDLKQVHSQFGINVQPHRLSNVVFDCHCRITFFNKDLKEIKKIKCELKSIGADSHCAVKNFLSSHELDRFLQRGSVILCNISVEKSSIKKACGQTENEAIKMCQCQDFKKLLLSEEGSDVTIRVRDQQFKAHRSILTARSSVFAAMFRHDMKENATGVVNIEDCDPSSFPLLLEFLYRGNTHKLSGENVFSLYTSADKYDVQGLKMKCFQFIKSNLSMDNFCETLMLTLQHSEANLLKLVGDFFAKNFKNIIVTTKWQALILENPVEVNEIFIKAFSSDI